MTRQYVGVEFSKGGRVYTYHNDGDPVVVGDLVDLDSNGGLKVVSVSDEKPKFKTKPILGKADMAPRPDDASPPTESVESAPIGHNNPPAYNPDVLADLQLKVDDFTDAAGAWLDLKEIETEEMAGKLVDFITGARRVHKSVEEARKAAKKPHDDAGKEVQAAFLPLLEKLDKSVKSAKALQTKYLQKKEAEAEAIRRREADEAAKSAEEARLRAAAAEARNDVSGQVDAEQDLKQAEKAEKAANNPVSVGVSSSTGGGRRVALRTRRHAEVENIFQAFNAYKDHPEIKSLLERLATADLRASKGADFSVPGFTIKEERVAA